MTTTTTKITAPGRENVESNKLSLSEVHPLLPIASQDTAGKDPVLTAGQSDSSGRITSKASPSNQQYPLPQLWNQQLCHKAFATRFHTHPGGSLIFLF